MESIDTSLHVTRKSSRVSQEKSRGRMKKRMTYFFCVSKIAYEIIKNTKNHHFLMALYRNFVHENCFRVFGNIILVKNLFRFMNRTNSRLIWTRTGQDRYYWKKVEQNVTVSPPKKTYKQFSFLLADFYLWGGGNVMSWWKTCVQFSKRFKSMVFSNK